MSSKLGPILNLGELYTQKSKESNESTNSQTNKETPQKYTNITKQVDESGDAYKRESTVASVSNVGVSGETRAFTPATNESRASTANFMRQNFENNNF